MQPADTNAPMRRASGGGADSRCARAGRDITLPGWYTIAPGDTLWAIADRHYASGGRFGRIHRANMQRIDDPGLIYPCQRVYLPRR